MSNKKLSYYQRSQKKDEGNRKALVWIITSFVAVVIIMSVLLIVFND